MSKKKDQHRVTDAERLLRDPRIAEFARDMRAERARQDTERLLRDPRADRRQQEFRDCDRRSRHG